MEEQTQIERLPFEGGLLSQQAHSQVRFENKGPNHRDHLELKGRGDKSAVNWIAPERHIKKRGVQLVAKIALDDDSFEAFKRMIQREARAAGGVSVNVWIQIPEPESLSSDEETSSSDEESSADETVNEESFVPGVREPMPLPGQDDSQPFPFDPTASFALCPSHAQVMEHVEAVAAMVAHDPQAKMWVHTGIIPSRLGMPLPKNTLSPVTCTHCRFYSRPDAYTHQLRDYGYSSSKGNIAGCPVCSTLAHSFDGYKERKASGKERRQEDYDFPSITALVSFLSVLRCYGLIWDSSIAGNRTGVSQLLRIWRLTLETIIVMAKRILIL